MVRRQAFTLIEMLVVFTIISILAGMSLPGVLTMIGKSTLRKSAEAVVSSSRQARQYALNRAGDGQTAYGVCIAIDTDGRHFATVIQGGANSVSDHLPRELKTPAPNSKPALRHYLPSGTEVWIGDQPLSATASKQLAWYFESRSGRPMALLPTGFSTGAIAVGFTPRIQTAGQLTSAWGIKDYNVPFTVLAPDTATSPGLTVRSGQKRLLVNLYPTGFINVVEP